METDLERQVNAHTLINLANAVARFLLLACRPGPATERLKLRYKAQDLLLHDRYLTRRDHEKD